MARGMECRTAIGLLLLASAGAAHGATCTATASSPQPRSWNAAATWSCGRVPLNNDDVVIPNGATVTLDVNTNRIATLTINTGGVLRGDNTNKTLTMDGDNAPDISNSGTIDFGAGNLATIFLRNDNEWSGAGTWNLSVIDLDNNALDFTSGSTFTINMSGAATPFTNNFGDLTSRSGMTWNFTGTVAQTLPTSANAVFGIVTISNTTGVTLGRNMTSSQLLGNLTVAANGILNNGGFSVTLASAKSFSAAAGAQFNLTGTSTMVTVSGGGTKTFNATSTVNYGGANQTVTAETYGNLTLSGSGSKTIASGTTTVAGNLTLASGVTYNGTSNNPTVNLAGNLSNSGTFNSGTGTFTFNGGSAQQITGTASGTTTFTRLTLNNANGLSLAGTHSVTVTTAATLTSGIITTNANLLYISNGSAIGSAGAGNFVLGNLKKRYTTTGSVTEDFEVGSVAGGSRYAPVNIRFGNVTAAGDFTVSTTAGDHPQIAASTLDPALGANRYWTLTNNSVSFAAHANNQIIFTFVNPGDLDTGADPATFIASRYDGASWTEITPSALTTTTTTISGTGITDSNVAGDYAVAKKFILVTAGGFNAYETGTAAGAISGVIKTKIAGGTISLDIIALDTARTAILTTFTGTVRVEVLNSSDNTGALDATTGCRASWTSLQTLSDPAFVSGDNGRRTISFTVANSYSDARLRVTFPVTSPTVTGCSNDNFTIRPDAFASFSVTDNDAQTPGTGRTLGNVVFTAGGTLHNAGRNFTVSASAVNAAGTPATTTNYAGSPTPTLTACAGASCTSSFGTFSLGAGFSSGQLSSNAASYGEVGSFALQLVDSAFASVDASDGSTATERNIVSAVINVGRFVPDHFAVTLNTPQFGTACGAGGFTYVGQSFNYTTQPVITVAAQDSSNNTTTLYTGAWWRITSTSVTPATQAARYSAATGSPDVSGLPAVASDPAVVDTGAGTGTLTFSSGTGIFFTRTTPAAPFDAELSLALNVIDADGVAYASNPARFGAATAGNGIGFNNGKATRFGRLRLFNANGSQLIAMPVAMQTQYWNGSGFVTNTLDSCTTLALNNVALGNYQRNLNSGETTVTIGGAFNSGVGTLRLSAPGAANNGSVDVSVNLTAATAGASCTAGMPASTGAGKGYLQGAWCGTAYTSDPTARATFGTYRGADQFIYQREDY